MGLPELLGRRSPGRICIPKPPRRTPEIVFDSSLDVLYGRGQNRFDVGFMVAITLLDRCSCRESSMHDEDERIHHRVQSAVELIAIGEFPDRAVQFEIGLAERPFSSPALAALFISFNALRKICSLCSVSS